MSIDKILKKLYNDKNLTPANAIRVPDPIATVSPALNYALNGGIRSGGFYCFSGPESSGKSFLALSCVAQLLRKNPEGVVFWFDVEKSFSEHFAKVLLFPDEYERCVIKRCDFGSDIFDYFENTNNYMLIRESHKNLKVIATSRVERIKEEIDKELNLIKRL